MPRRLEVDDGALAAALGRRPVQFRHHLTGHPGFELEAIAQLAVALPGAWVGPHPADQALVQATGMRRVDGDAGELARAIAVNGARLTLQHVDRVRSYRDLLEACLGEVGQVLEGREGGQTWSDALIFLASPHAVVPAHLDRHHNLLMQVAGTKDLTIGTFSDADEQRRQVEVNFATRAMTATALPVALETFRLEPGDGLYIPPYTFHWVQGGVDVSVAFSCGFSTAESDRTALVHACNARLRRLGLPTRPPGRSPRRDRAKAALMGRARRLRQRARGRDS